MCFIRLRDMSRFATTFIFAYGPLTSPGASSKIISWHRCKTRWQTINDPLSVCSEVTSLRWACMNHRVCINVRKWQCLPIKLITHIYGHMRRLFASVYYETFQSSWLWRSREQEVAERAITFYPWHIKHSLATIRNPIHLAVRQCQTPSIDAWGSRLFRYYRGIASSIVWQD